MPQDLKRIIGVQLVDEVCTDQENISAAFYESQLSRDRDF